MTDATTPRETELRSRLAGPAGEWVAETRAPAGDHPDVDELIAYHSGEVAEADERRIQDHLVTCRGCLEHLLELDSFTATEPALEGRAERPAGAAVTAGVADLETAAAWRALRSRLPAGPARVPRWAAALAASLAVAVVGLAFVSIERHREAGELSRRVAELSQPQLGVDILDPPAPVVRGEGDEPQVLELPAAGYATLILSLPVLERPETGSFDRYAVEILDSTDRVLWSGDTGEVSRGTLTLGLHGGYLPPGEYSLRLYGLDGEERHWIESHTIRVAGS